MIGSTGIGIADRFRWERQQTAISRSRNRFGIAMKNYEYHRIRELAKQLGKAGIEQDTIDKIMEGGKNILRKTSPAKKADWMREAMFRMNELLDQNTRKIVREACACRLTGKPLKASQAIARENRSLEDRIKAADKSFSAFGGCIRMQENGEILARFSPEGLDHYRCPCLPGADKPLPVTYCICCGGQIKYHLQISLGLELDYTILSTALSSGGKFPCTFSLRIDLTITSSRGGGSDRKKFRIFYASARPWDG